MQSVKYLIIAAVCSTASALQAAPTTDLPPAPQPQSAAQQPANAPTARQPTDVSASQPPVNSLQPLPTASLPPVEKTEEVTMQEHIQKLVEEDYEFQTELRRLNNQVEVEKKRNEIRKLKGEDKIKPAPPAPVSQNENKPTPNTEGKSASSVPLPHVLLESVIGGLSRVAVVNNSRSKLLYVKPGDSFIMDGQSYLLIRDSRLGLQVKDVTP